MSVRITVTHGLIVHPNGEPTGTVRVTYRLAGRSETLKGTVFSRPDRTTPVFAEVLGDGKPLWKSDDLTILKYAVASFDINVRGVRKLTLVATSEKEVFAAHVLWKEPYLCSGSLGKATTTTTP